MRHELHASIKRERQKLEAIWNENQDRKVSQDCGMYVVSRIIQFELISRHSSRLVFRQFRRPIELVHDSGFTWTSKFYLNLWVWKVSIIQLYEVGLWFENLFLIIARFAPKITT